MKNLLEKLFENETLTYDESKSVLLEISAKKYDDSLIASFLTVYKMRMPCVEEIEGFRDALLDLCLKIDFDDFICPPNRFNRASGYYTLFQPLLKE